MFESWSQGSFRSSITLPPVSPEGPTISITPSTQEIFQNDSSNISLPPVSDIPSNPATQETSQNAFSQEYELNSPHISLPPVSDSPNIQASQEGSLKAHSYEYLHSSPSISLPPVSDSPLSPNEMFDSLPSVTEEEDHFMFQMGDIYGNEISSDPDKFHSVLCEATEELGLDSVVDTILAKEDLKDALITKILKTAHGKMKMSLKESILRANEQKKNRDYLLSLTPHRLCQELEELSPDSSKLLLGLLGVSDMSVVLESKHLQNMVALLYSCIAKTMNKQACGFAILQTSNARDGGMREDSLKLNPNFVAPRTVQRYDKEVLSKDWDRNLQELRKKEERGFKALRDAELDLKAAVDEASISEAHERIKTLTDSLPRQTQCVWDNINLHTNPKYHRKRDSYSDYNKDWMASMWILERINANHMSHIPGHPLKDPSELSIEDFVPSIKEKDYIFSSLVYYFASRLVERYPEMFKSLNSSIKANKPHQFESEMASRSEEFTGDLFTKSESNTEDIVSMMQDIQLKATHTYAEDDGSICCYEKKVISGDNKTEKNSHYGILRFVILLHHNCFSYFDQSVSCISLILCQTSTD